MKEEVEAIIANNQQVKERTCLMCGEVFPSSGPGNRRCMPCEMKMFYSERNGQFTYYMPVRYAVQNEGLIALQKRFE